MTISNRVLEYFAVNLMVWMTQLYIIDSNGEEGAGKKKDLQEEMQPADMLNNKSNLFT